MNPAQRIAEIEHEIAITQKNKATMSHLCLLKARLAKLKREIIDQAAKAGNGLRRASSWRRKRGRLRREQDGRRASGTDRLSVGGKIHAPEQGTILSLPPSSPASTPKSPNTNSPPSPASPASSNTRERRSSCWTCRELLRAPRTARAGASRSSVLPAPAPSFLLSSMRPSRWFIRGLSSANSRATAFVSIRSRRI